MSFFFKKQLLFIFLYFGAFSLLKYKLNCCLLLCKFKHELTSFVTVRTIKGSERAARNAAWNAPPAHLLGSFKGPGLFFIRFVWFFFKGSTTLKNPEFPIVLHCTLMMSRNVVSIQQHLGGLEFKGRTGFRIPILLFFFFWKRKLSELYCFRRRRRRELTGGLAP